MYTLPTVHRSITFFRFFHFGQNLNRSEIVKQMKQLLPKLIVSN